MAGIALPLITTFAPELINLIAGLVHKSAPAAEAANGPGTGPVKFAQVFQDVISALNNAAVAGTISKTLPPDETIKTVIQAVVSSMNMTGLLGPPVQPSVPPPQQIWLTNGQSLVIGVR